MLEAIFGLAGVIVGGAMTGATQHLAQRSRARSELRQVARLLDVEYAMLKALAGAEACGDHGTTDARERFLVVPAAWGQASSVLAREFADYKAWAAVAQVPIAVEIVKVTLDSADVEDDQARVAWRELDDALVKAHTALLPLLGR